LIFKVLKFNSIRFWSKLVNVLFLLFFVFLVIGAQIHHANQEVKNVDILIDVNVGDNFLAPSEIKNHILLKYDSVLGKRIGDVSLNEVENLVQNIDGVAKADAYFNTNGHLQIKVEQKKAICRVLTPDGKGYYIDNKGLIMPWVSVYTPNVFVCTGYISKYGKGLDSLKTNKELNKGVFKLYQLLENNEFMKQLISYFYIDKNGNFWLYPVIGNHKFNWGKLEDLEVKIKKTETFYSKIIPIKGWDLYKEIDLRFNQQIVCK
jgi:cell division protein FtsQ